MFTRQRYVAGDLTGQSRAERGERFYLFGHLSLSLFLRLAFSRCRPVLAKTTPTIVLSFSPLAFSLFRSFLYTSDHGSLGGNSVQRVNVV